MAWSMTTQTGDIKQLATLVEVSQTLASTLNLEAALYRVLEILEYHHSMVPSMVTLLHEQSSELGIAVANGLPADGMQARYNIGEGITGRVVESGKPIIVPQISHEPMFLNRAGRRRNLQTQERTFICVPVIINRRPVGTLGVDLRFRKNRDYDRELKFLHVVASMIAQAINIHHLVEAERQRLRDENQHLREELRERYDFANIIGNSSRMRQVYEQITKVAYTNRDLEEAIAGRVFREDLYYRLNVFSIFVPPLREHRDDVLLLGEHFLEKYAREHGKPIKRIATSAIDMLASYHWPGNVRELENVIERAVLVCEGQVIHGYHLPATLQTAEGSGTVPHVSLTESIEAFERDLIQDALKTTRGNRAKAAKLLHTTERIIGYKAKKYAIDCKRFRA